jgi:hypothetical protein
MKVFFKPLERLLDGPVKPDHDERSSRHKLSFDELISAK